MAKPTRLTQDMIDEYKKRGVWDDVPIADILEGNAERYPDKEAVVDSETRLTWAELNNMADRIAIGLMEKGIERDQAIVAQLPTSINVVILLMACHKAGIFCCFPPMTFRHSEIKHLLKTLNPSAIITPLRYRNMNYFDMAREAASDLLQVELFFVIGDEVPAGAISFEAMKSEPFEQTKPQGYLKEYAFSPFEVSSIVLTSGTTGLPKCIEHTGASSKAGGWGIVQRAKMNDSDIIGNIAPFSGGPGLQNWWAGFQVGATTCLLERFTPDDALQLIEREQVTYLSVIPTQLIRILKECNLDKHNLSSLKIVRTGAAAFDASLARETEERLNCKVLIAGGSQETYSFAQTGVDDPPEKRLATLGRPFPGNEVRITNEKRDELPPGEVGQLSVRGASTSSGYYGNENATLAAWGEFGKEGWYQTGDLAKLDDQGYLLLVGRKKELIIRGGQNIYPKEIEDLLLSHPSIMQAVVIGIPDLIMGEKACACIALTKKQRFEFEEMTSFLKEKGLAVHKLPERLEVFERFPQLVDGQKVDKISLKKLVINNIEKECGTAPCPM
jgi:non-ribosomal peptide synthetase component E (peptide arylation enzyme)